MHRSMPSFHVTCIVVAVTAHNVLAQGTFRELVQRVPSAANALVILNVEKALNSPLAVKEDWKLKQEASFASGMIVLPPKASRFVLATEMDLESLEPKWEIAVMHMSARPLLAGFSSPKRSPSRHCRFICKKLSPIRNKLVRS